MTHWRGVVFGSKTLAASVVAMVVGLAAAPAFAGRARALSAGTASTCAIGRGGEPWCWGRNNAGQLGDGTTIEQHWPKRVLNFAGMAVTRDDNICLLLLGNVVFCAGANNFGQIGDGTTTERHHITQAGPGGFRTGLLYPFTAGNTPCAVDSGVSCWGWNQFGGVGDGTTIDRVSPVPITVAVNQFAQIESSGADGHTCVVGADRRLWCWGNLDAQSNGPPVGPQSAPAPVIALGATLLGTQGSIGVGVDHTCAIKTDGTLWCWGHNEHGQLGDGTTVGSDTPVQVTAISASVQAVSVSPSGAFTCALTSGQASAGAAFCWGRNDRGQLGDGTTTERHLPTTVAVKPIAEEIAAGDDHTCLFSRDQSFWCWGANDHGQVGNGTTIDQHTPVAIPLAPAPPPSVPALSSGVGAWALALMLLACGLGSMSRRPRC